MTWGGSMTGTQRVLHTRHTRHPSSHAAVSVHDNKSMLRPGVNFCKRFGWLSSLEHKCSYKDTSHWKRTDFARFSVFPHEDPLWFSWERSLLVSNKKEESPIQRQPSSRKTFSQLQRTLDEAQGRICSWARRRRPWCHLRGSLHTGFVRAAEGYGWEKKELHSSRNLFSWHWGDEARDRGSAGGTGQSAAAVKVCETRQKEQDVLSKRHQTRTHRFVQPC